jgi:signal transduction histidine kinase
MRDTTEIFYTILLASVFFLLLAAVIVIATWRYYSRKRTHEMAVLQFDHTLLQTRLEIQEQTFTSISQEIHDNLGQLLSLAKLQLNTMSFEKPDQAKEKLHDAVGLISQTIQSLRDLARNLHSETINQSGLIKALETEIRMIEKLGIMQSGFRVSGTPVSLDKNKSLIIFRIVQEALHNVIKHAKASLVDLQVHFSREHVKVTIKDNGTGFDGAGNKEGSGLRNMKDRARVIGAEFRIESTPASGTFITLNIPQS